MKLRLMLSPLLLLALGTPASAQGPDVVILPETAILDGPNASQRFLVERRDGEDLVGDWTHKANFSVDNLGVATVNSDGVVTPVGDGTATLTAIVEGTETRAAITVKDFGAPSVWSFRNHVLPVMTKAGCNQGSCHGAAAGKNGLRLTLRGYGPEVDYDVLTRQANARRINRTAPAESLFLLKPTAALEHGGGQRFTTDSPEYRVLAEWIAAGTPPPGASDPSLVSITVFPESVRLHPNERQGVIVQASYSDGKVEDVTRWAKFGSTDETVARVDENGHLTVEGHGEAAVTVWFNSLVQVVSIASPYGPAIDPRIFADAPRSNPIDDLNLRKLRSLNIPPSPPANDATFLRRAYLDATGTLPTVAEVDAFLADTSPDKREALVDRLLNSQEYVDYWAYKWSDLLLVSSKKLPSPAMWSFYRTIRKSVEANQPWDQFARSILTARGSTLRNGAGNYFVLHRDPIDLTESTSMAFLGMSLTCARCHNHPMEKWTQDQYYGVANLFSRVTLKDGPTAGDVIVSASPEGNVIHPRKGTVMAPQALDAPPLPLDFRGDRREAFADWLARPDNPYFSRAIVNRVWRNFFARGLIDPEDDLRATNPPSDRGLLDWLVSDFQAHGYDVKHLVRTIMTSATYARSSNALPGNEMDSRFLSHYPVRRLSAETLLDAISRVTEMPTTFPGYPEGWRSTQLPDVQLASTFLSSFGRPERISTCSCERSSEPSVSQALHLANGETLNDKLRDDKAMPARLAVAPMSEGEILDVLFKSALSRAPTDEERARLRPYLIVDDPDPKKAATMRREAIEDVAWGLLTGKEFLFNH